VYYHIIYLTQANRSELLEVMKRTTCFIAIVSRDILSHWKTFPLSLKNKLLIYKTVLKPAWTYGIELWGCVTKSNIAVIQRHQSKLLRTITNAPRYVSNQTLHSDLYIPHVRTVFRERTAIYHTTLDSHPNPLMEPLVHPPNKRRLKRRWTFDEIH